MSQLKTTRTVLHILLFQDHPGTDTLSVNLYNDAESVVNMMRQVREVGKKMVEFMNKHPGGVNLICFSQGLTISIYLFIYFFNCALPVVFPPTGSQHYSPCLFVPVAYMATVQGNTRIS